MNISAVVVIAVVDPRFNVEFVTNMGDRVVGMSVVVGLTPVFVVTTTVWVISVAFASF